ncbi:MAG: hypothetical protein AB7F86_00215 [Bdellovibrionales bacterium]
MDVLRKLLQISTPFLLPFSVAALDCPSGTYHVSAHPRKAYYRADGTFVKATQVSESCRETNAVYDTWSPILKTGSPPNWENKSEKPSQWTEEQRTRLIEALNELPEALQRLPVKGIYRMSKSIFFPNPASNDNDGRIVLYDSAFGQDQRLARILAHELAHEVFVNFTDLDRASYRQALGWIAEFDPESRKFLYKERSGQFVKPDGRQGPNEDFANNLEYYLFEAKVLKRTTPKAFDWISNRFNANFRLGSPAK